MKKILLVGLLVGSGLCFAEDRLSLAEIASASDEQVQKQIDSINAEAQARQDAFSGDMEALKKQRAALAKKPNARIGMTAKQVRTGTNWGEPDKINDTIDASGSFQQWVYGDEYLYFKNGRLVSIQTSR